MFGDGALSTARAPAKSLSCSAPAQQHGAALRLRIGVVQVTRGLEHVGREVVIERAGDEIERASGWSRLAWVRQQDVPAPASRPMETARPN
jgi:hypothetical protein